MSGERSNAVVGVIINWGALRSRMRACASAAEAKSLGFDANAQLRVVYFLGGLQSDRGFNNRRWGLISWLCKLGLRSLFSIYDKSEAKLIRPERIPLGMNNVNCMFRNRRRR